jgi:pimeloyl-ACP methyl ester carboxylesterase
MRGVSENLESSVTMSNFVLIHGAMVGGWCWHYVTPYLRAAGHDVCSPTLTGHGDRVHLATPDIDLDTHIHDVVNLLYYEDLTDVVLVGWSYGGMIAAGVADRVPQRIAHVVYLDSDVPRNGDTSVPLSQHAFREELACNGGDSWRIPPEFMVSKLAMLPDEVKSWVVPRLTPHLLRTWLQPIRLTGAASSIPTTYIRCTVGYDPTDEDTKRQDERIRSEPSWRYKEIADHHFCVWTSPAIVAGLLLEAV